MYQPVFKLYHSALLLLLRYYPFYFVLRSRRIIYHWIMHMRISNMSYINTVYNL